MNNITLKVRGAPKNSLIFLDDKLIKTKKDSFGNKMFKGQTSKNEVSLKIYKVQELTLKNWWLYEILYFILSIFGLFDYRAKTGFYDVTYEANITLKENSELEMSFDRKSENAFQIKQTNIELNEKENKKEQNLKAKKRFKWTIVCKVLAWILAAVVVCLCLFI